MSPVHKLIGLMFVAWMFCESHQQFGRILGPFDFLLEQVYACEDQGSNKMHMNISLYLGKPDNTRYRTRERLHRGSFSWPFTKQEQTTRMKIQSDIFLKRSNNYLLMHKANYDYCKTMAFTDQFYKSLKKAIGVTQDGCEIPVGNYTFNDWAIVFTIPIPMAEYGSYKGVSKYMVGNETVGCLTFLADVKPKNG